MSKSNIHIVGTSDDGDRIYCTYKVDKTSVVRGMYDFNLGRFIVLNFYKNKVPENTTPLKVLLKMKEDLDIEYDWELSGIAKIVTLIESGEINSGSKRKRRHKKKNKQEI